MTRIDSGKRGRAAFVVVAAAVVVFGLGLGASEARPAASDQVTISMLDVGTVQPGWDVLIPNFERVYPNIKVNITYAPTNTALYQLEATELAAGNAPDLIASTPGCGTPIAVCVLAKAGDLAPLVNKRWVKWSLPQVTSESKYGQALVAFVPIVAPLGIFTNDTLFAKLGLKLPQTFAQLLDICRSSKAMGTAAVLLAGGSPAVVDGLIETLAVSTVYGQDRHWTSELKAGKVTFDGSPGWRQTLQQFVEMNNAGCFQQGATGVSSGTIGAASFAQGQGLMFPITSNNKSAIDAASPQFSYSLHPFPGRTSPTQPTMTLLSPLRSLSVNAHASAENQAAAQTFIDFIARPKQDALLAKVLGGLTQYQLLKGEIPAFMSSFATVFDQHEYVIFPHDSWWNASVLLTLERYQIGLITGQSTIDDVLNAMDAAWKEGPS